MLGGVALMAGMMAALAVASIALDAATASVLVAMVLLFALGLTDDRRGVGVLPKLVVQAVAAAVVVAGGWTLAIESPVWAAVSTGFWLVAMVNATNLLDNQDGAVASVAALAAGAFLVLQPAPSLGSALAGGVLGGCIGFLIYNAPPARIFLGDAGSLPLGLALGVAGLALHRSIPPERSAAWLVPLLVLMVPILDTTWVSLGRLARGKNPLTSPGTDHLAHRLNAVVGPRGAIVALMMLGLVGALTAGWVMGVADS